MTQNDIGDWVQVNPSGSTPTDSSTTVTLTRQQSVDVFSQNNMVMLAMVLGVVGIIGLVTILYIMRDRR